MNTELIAAAIVGIIIQAVILYYVVKGAVSDATKRYSAETINQIKLLNRLKIRELQKSGVSNEELQKDIDFVFKAK
jgi:hypothetical protein